MVGVIQPLSNNLQIIKEDGTPTDYFIRWAQQRQIDIGNGITAADAQALIDTWAASRDIIAGDGLDGGGPLSSDVTIDANASDILDLISSTQGTVLYRGASAWAGLAPGTSGHFLKTNGAGANPEWAAGGGGGSGAWTLISEVVTTGSAATVTFSAIAGSYKHLAFIYKAKGDAAGVTNVDLLVQFNSDTGGNYTRVRWVTAANGGTSGSGGSVTATSSYLGRLPAATAPATGIGAGEVFLEYYADTVFNKTGNGKNSNRLTTATSGYNQEMIALEWFNTAAITQIDILLSAGNFVDGSRFALYGIA